MASEFSEILNMSLPLRDPHSNYYAHLSSLERVGPGRVLGTAGRDLSGWTVVTTDHFNTLRTYTIHVVKASMASYITRVTYT